MAVVVTKDVGGSAKPVGLLYIEPALQMAPAPDGLVAAGVDAAFTADLLSACLAHERCGLHLYRSVAQRTEYDDLRAQYARFGEETAEHIRLLEEFVTAGGGDPMYISPAARATEKAAAGLVESTFLLGGSIDPVTAELAMLEAVMLAEAKDLENWELLAALAQQMAVSPARELLETMSAEVLAQEEEHYGWARATRATMLLTLSVGTAPQAEPEPDQQSGAGSGDETVDLAAWTKDELYSKAQELDIEGRSQMSKDELADAVGAEIGEAR